MVVFKKDDMEKKNNDEFDMEMGGVSLGGVSKPWSLATPFKVMGGAIRRSYLGVAWPKSWPHIYRLWAGVVLDEMGNEVVSFGRGLTLKLATPFF